MTSKHSLLAPNAESTIVTVRQFWLWIVFSWSILCPVLLMAEIPGRNPGSLAGQGLYGEHQAASRRFLPEKAVTSASPFIFQQTRYFAAFFAESGTVPPQSPALSPAQEPRTDWYTGNRLEQQLSSMLSITWQDASLKASLNNLSQQQQIAIFFDRRVDPSTVINLEMRERSFEQVLWAAVEQVGCGVCRIDDMYYIGPSEDAHLIPLLMEDLRDETRRNQNRYDVKWRDRRSLKIPSLSNPASILKDLGLENGFELVGNSLEHDRWSEFTSPPLALEQRVALLCIGFGQWFERSRDGSQLRLIPRPTKRTATRRYLLPKTDSKLLDKIRKEFPECKISGRGKTFSATGVPAELAAIERICVEHRNHQKVDDSEQRRFTLKTRASRGRILATIAQQSGNRLVFDPSLNAVLQEHVEIDVHQVPLARLIQATLEGSGLRYRLKTGRLTLERASEKEKTGPGTSSRNPVKE